MTFENEFGLWERLLHHLAFRTGFSQVMLADLEERIFADDTSGVTVDRPVFLSGLPRSGTTILLELLNATGHFATHTYEDMPFLLCPLLWSRFARRFVVDRAPRERAHGDGLEISSRSPEAFEEMVWKRFWPDHYQADRIEPWTSTDRNAEFAEFFKRHMAKIIAVRERGRPDSAPLRYLSKNNVTISRLSGVPGPLRRGIFVVPFRDPFQQAASMLLQHRRFSELHRQDRFACRYMDGIGHHDFGLSLRPINFGRWLEHAGNSDDIEFWLRYWNAAYQHVLDHLNSSIHLVSFAQLASEPEMALRRIADATQLPASELLVFTGRLRPASPHAIDYAQVPPALRDEAIEIYQQLERAL